MYPVRIYLRISVLQMPLTQMEELHRKEMAGANQMVARRAQELGRIHEQVRTQSMSSASLRIRPYI